MGNETQQRILSRGESGGALQAASVLVSGSIQLSYPTRVRDIKTFCLIIQSQTVSSEVFDVSASIAGG